MAREAPLLLHSGEMDPWPVRSSIREAKNNDRTPTAGVTAIPA
jgi:hypothetical protein